MTRLQHLIQTCQASSPTAWRSLLYLCKALELLVPGESEAAGLKPQGMQPRQADLCMYWYFAECHVALLSGTHAQCASERPGILIA